MPYISAQFSLPINDIEKQQLATGITTILSDTLRKKAELTAVNISEVSKTQWFINSSALNSRFERSAYIEINISKDTNTDTEKEQTISEIHTLLESVLGPLSEASYITIKEIPKTDWGYSGVTQQQRSIKRTPSGAIDTDHYISQGRQARVTGFASLLQLFRA